jgi:hypothetical protein
MWHIQEFNIYNFTETSWLLARDILKNKYLIFSVACSYYLARYGRQTFTKLVRYYCWQNLL